MDKHFFYRLAEKYLDGTATTDERELVEAYYEHLSTQDAGISVEMKQRVKEQILRELETAIHSEPARVRRIFTWPRVAAAASIIFIISLGTYFFFSKKPARQTDIVKTPTLNRDVPAPATNRAMITLANGQSVYLDSAANGTLAQQGGVNVVKLDDGQIAYRSSSSSGPEEVGFNTLTNPRGSKIINMTLADGSKVWLNAGSSVTYPVVFVSNERKVQITGEAYFEVAGLPLAPSGGGGTKRPFIVSVLRQSQEALDVQVLGTHFNINAYDDESDIKVTLLEGSVKVSLPLTPSGGGGTNSVILKPGEQAKVKPNSPLGVGGVVGGADLEETMAWKNGFFSFHSADIPTVMRQLSRWYDVEVVFTSGIPKREFEGSIDKSLSLAKVLAILERMKVHFRIEEGNKILILP